MDDQVRLLVLWRRLQVDDHQLAACASAATDLYVWA